MKFRPPRLRDRWILIWSSLCGLLVIACTGLILALVASSHSNDAATRAKEIAACVNNVLAVRSPPTAADNQAHIAFAKALEALISSKPKTPAEQAQVVAKFKAAAGAYSRVLVEDQQVREAHPLGRC